MRALITNFYITSLIWKVDKNMNILGIAIMLIGRYGGHKWQMFWFKGGGCTRRIHSQYRFLASKAR